MCSFDNCARYNRWSRTDKLAHLRWSLTGTAAQLLWSAEDLSYEELVENSRVVLVVRGWRVGFRKNYAAADAREERH